MEDDLTCPVCLEIFTNPIVLNCNHNVCLHCAQLLHKLSNEKDEFKCPRPKCGRSTKLDSPDTTLLELKHNNTLRDTIRELKEGQIQQTSKEKVFPICSRCEESTATLQCEQCDECFCEACANVLHSLGKWKQHNVVPLGTLRKLKCLEHSKDVEYACLEDNNALVCTSCVLVGKHRNHKCITIDEAIKLAKDRLGSNLQIVDSQKDKLKGILNKIMETIQAVQLEKENMTKEIETDFNTLKHSLEQREQQLLAELQRISDDKVQKLNTQREQLLVLINQMNNGILKGTTLLNSNDINVIETQNGLENSLRIFKEQEQMEPCVDSSIWYCNDVVALTGKLLTIGSLSEQKPKTPALHLNNGNTRNLIPKLKMDKLLNSSSSDSEDGNYPSYMNGLSDGTASPRSLDRLQRLCKQVNSKLSHSKK